MTEQNQNSAAHWCKVVLEQAVPIPQFGNIPAYNSTQNAYGGVIATGSIQSPTNPVVTQYPSLYNNMYGYQALQPSNYYNGTNDANGLTNPAGTNPIGYYGYNSNQNAAISNPGYQFQYNQSINPTQQQWTASQSGATTWTTSAPYINTNYQQPTQINPLQSSQALTQLSNQSQAVNSQSSIQATPQVTTTTTSTLITNSLTKQQQIIIMPPVVSSIGTAKKPNPSRFSAVPVTTISTETTDTNSSAPSDIHAKRSKVEAAISNPLKNFITRAFLKCDTEDKRDLMTKELNRIIDKVKADKRLSVHKWDLEPVPTISLSSSLETSVGISETSDSQQKASTTGENNDANSNPSNSPTKKRKSRWNTDADGNISFKLDNSDIKPKYGIDMSSLTKVTENKKKASSIVPAAEGDLVRQKRLGRFQIDNSINIATATVKVEKKLKKSFQSKINASTNISGDSSEFDLESLKIVGTSQVLEKDYFRLTSPPDPATVRPVEVLKKALKQLKLKWQQSSVEYIYMCSQLKAIRQDLTVQNIRNEFMVHVYETHARIALEVGDLNEYNQCQTQLKQLYDSGLPGSEMEFTAYRILYYVYLQGNKKYQNGSSDLASILATLPDKAKRDDAVKHALAIREATRRENYHRFFKLYEDTPNMGSYILDLMLDNLRLQVLTKMMKAYKPHIPLSWVSKELRFSDEGIGERFLLTAGCVIEMAASSEVQGNGGSDSKEKVVVTKDSVIDASAVLTQDKLLL